MSEGLKASSGWEMGSKWGVLMGFNPAGPGPIGAAGVAPVPNSFDRLGNAEEGGIVVVFGTSAAHTSSQRSKARWQNTTVGDAHTRNRQC